MTMHSFMSAVYSAFGWLDQPSFMSIYSTSTQTLVQRSGRIPSPARHWTSPKTMGCRSSWTHAARSIWNSSAKPCVVMDLCYAPLIYYNNIIYIISQSQFFLIFSAVSLCLCRRIVCWAKDWFPSSSGSHSQTSQCPSWIFGGDDNIRDRERNRVLGRIEQVQPRCNTAWDPCDPRAPCWQINW